MPKAPLDEIVHRSELLPPTFGDMALGGGLSTLVVWFPFVVTVEFVVWSTVVVSAIAEKDNIRKHITMPNAIALYVCLLILLVISR